MKPSQKATEPTVTRRTVLTAMSLCPVAVTVADAAHAAPSRTAAPDLGPNVTVFGPDTPTAEVQARLDEVFRQQETDQFGDNRFALLFEPGSYDVDANIGFYTQILGLGTVPDEVVISGAVHAEADWFDGNATHNFWRGAENLAVEPAGGTDRWAVSQAAPYRRMHLRGDIELDDGGWSSGGLFADTKIDGQVRSGTQQQWLSRNTELADWNGSNWNMVFVGVDNPPGGDFPSPPHTRVDSSPVVREKPFLHVDAQGSYHVFVPAPRRDAVGTSWSSGTAVGDSLPLEQFHIAKPGATAADLNDALEQGLDLLITPGIYHLDDTVRVTRPGTVVLGLGLATLIPDGGVTAMTVADVDGVVIAGLLFDAGGDDSEVLMEVGGSGSDTSHAENPTSLHDLYFRVGGSHVGRATDSLVINSHNVIGDHLWIWRGDHGEGIGWDLNTADTGLIVNGDDVVMYGLFVEHYQRHQTIWNGERGRTYFYQNEMPYDPPDQAAWMDGDTEGYAAYKVDDAVSEHEVWGLGSYCFFSSDPSVVAARAVEAPDTPGVRFHHLTAVSLGGTGTIRHVVNDTGGPADSGNNVATVTEYP